MARGEGEVRVNDAYQEPTDAEFLRDLAERIMHIPVCHGVDGGDSDRLCWIADKIEKAESDE
jgi:hypothetical protein